MPARLRTFLGAAAAATVVSLCSAQAATVSETLRDFGLLGSWATQCNAAATIDNNHRTYSVVSEDIVQEYNDLGPDYEPNIATITAAGRVAPNQLQINSTLQSGAVRTLLIVMRGNTIRTMSNVRSDGAVLVKDGIVQSNGNATPALTRCK